MRNEDQKIQEQVGALLGSLKRVEAPGDFDFKVRARIAKGRPSTSPGSWLPASVKLAMPLGLMLMVGGYFAFNAVYSPENANVPVVAEIPAANPQPMPFAPVIERPVLTSNQTVAAVTDVKAQETGDNTKSLRAGIRKTSNSTRSTEPRGGSVDSAVREGKTIFPAGANTVVKSPETPEPVFPARITAKDSLKNMGITATFAAGGWKVESVAADSTAGRSGVKVGDTIEALNGKRLAEKATFDSGSDAKGVRVRRDGRTMIVDLRP